MTSRRRLVNGSARGTGPDTRPVRPAIARAGGCVGRGCQVIAAVEVTYALPGRADPRRSAWVGRPAACSGVAASAPGGRLRSGDLLGSSGSNTGRAPQDATPRKYMSQTAGGAAAPQRGAPNACVPRDLADPPVAAATQRSGRCVATAVAPAGLEPARARVGAPNLALYEPKPAGSRPAVRGQRCTRQDTA